MRLENLTDAPAALFVADFGTDVRHAVVVWKLSYVLPSSRGEGWTPCEDPMPISGNPVSTPHGVFHGDIFLRKAGADLCVLGWVRRTEPIVSTSVTVRCGEFVHGLRVTGDRTWERRLRGLVPSDPEPFVEMPLSYERTFGGVAVTRGMDVPFPDNPVGRGYVLDPDAALGAPLPNIEADLAAPITSWDERPRPAGWGPYPMFWGLRAHEGVTIDPELQLVSEVSPTLFNNAHPDLILPEITPGASLELSGVRDEGLAWTLPTTLARLQVRVGSERFDVGTAIDGVYLWIDEARLVITQRANFSYVVRPEQVRVATLAEIQS